MVSRRMGAQHAAAASSSTGSRVVMASTSFDIDKRRCSWNSSGVLMVVDIRAQGPDGPGPRREGPPMSRVQLALNVDDLDSAVGFYSRLFGAEPAKVRPGYANFAIAEPPLKLVLIEN